VDGGWWIVNGVVSEQQLVFVETRFGAPEGAFYPSPTNHPPFTQVTIHHSPSTIH
jgi:hypothetical protein